MCFFDVVVAILSITAFIIIYVSLMFAAGLSVDGSIMIQNFVFVLSVMAGFGFFWIPKFLTAECSRQAALQGGAQKDRPVMATVPTQPAGQSTHSSSASPDGRIHPTSNAQNEAIQQCQHTAEHLMHTAVDLNDRARLCQDQVNYWKEMLIHLAEMDESDVSNSSGPSPAPSQPPSERRMHELDKLESV